MLNTFIICSRTEKKCKKYDNNGETAKHTQRQKQHKTNATTVTVTAAATTTTQQQQPVVGTKNYETKNQQPNMWLPPTKEPTKGKCECNKQCVGCTVSRHPVGQKMGTIFGGNIRDHTAKSLRSILASKTTIILYF